MFPGLCKGDAAVSQDKRKPHRCIHALGPACQQHSKQLIVLIQVIVFLGKHMEGSVRSMVMYRACMQG